MILNDLFQDLIAVPGLRAVILFDSNAVATMHIVGEENQTGHSTVEQDRFLRGAGQILKSLKGMLARIEMRYAGGRFIVKTLPNGLTIACVTSQTINLPLLEITLDAYAQAANQNPQGVADTFRAGEIAKMFADITSEKSVSVTSTLRSLRSVQVELAKLSTTPNKNSFNAISPFASREPIPSKEVSPSPISASLNLQSLTTVGEVAAGLCEISDCAARFLGRSVVANYWRQTQFDEWKPLVEITMDGQLNPRTPNQPLSFELWQTSQDWAKKFVQRCSVIVVDIADEIAGSLQDKGKILLNGSNEIQTVQARRVS